MTRLLLLVDGRLRASVEDTPEGRVQIDKLAMIAREETDGAVEVRRGGAKVPEEAGTEPFGRGQAAVPVTSGAREGGVPPVPASPGALDAAVARHPAGSNICRSCRPRFRHGPSGPALWHDNRCPDKPGQKIDVAEYAQGRQWGSWEFRKAAR